jgi:hypothetical protein
MEHIKIVLKWGNKQVIEEEHMMNRYNIHVWKYYKKFCCTTLKFNKVNKLEENIVKEQKLLF